MEKDKNLRKNQAENESITDEEKLRVRLKGVQAMSISMVICMLLLWLVDIARVGNNLIDPNMILAIIFAGLAGQQFAFYYFCEKRETFYYHSRRRLFDLFSGIVMLILTIIQFIRVFN